VEKAIAAFKDTLEGPVTPEPARADSPVVRSASWTNGVSSVVNRNPSGHGRAVSVIVAALCITLGVGIAVTRAERPHRDESPPAQALRPQRAVTPAPMEVPRAEPATVDGGSVALEAVALPDAGSVRVVVAPRFARRQFACRASVRRPTPDAVPTPVVTRGFNGAPIVD